MLARSEGATDEPLEQDPFLMLDIEHERALMRVTDPEELIDQLIREAHEFPDAESEYIEPMIDLVTQYYGTTPRKLSPTLSILHPLRLAQASPSEGVLSSKVKLIRLGHDLVEVFGMDPEDLNDFGGSDVVYGVTAMTHAEGEDYAVYLRGVRACNKQRPDLRLTDAKRRDMQNNTFDPVGLPIAIPRREDTAVVLTGIITKYEGSIGHLILPGEPGFKTVKEVFRQGREAVKHPQLILPAGVRK